MLKQLNPVQLKTTNLFTWRQLTHQYGIANVSNWLQARDALEKTQKKLKFLVNFIVRTRHGTFYHEKMITSRLVSPKLNYLVSKKLAVTYSFNIAKDKALDITQFLGYQALVVKHGV